MRILQALRNLIPRKQEKLADEAGATESSQTENQASSSEFVPPAEQVPTTREERLVSDPEGAIEYGKTRAA